MGPRRAGHARVVDPRMTELLGHALRDSNVRTLRPLRAAGVYVDAEDLAEAARFWADGGDVDARAIDAYVEEIGGHRLGRFLWRTRAQYFFPHVVYQAARVRRRPG